MDFWTTKRGFILSILFSFCSKRSLALGISFLLLSLAATPSSADPYHSIAPQWLDQDQWAWLMAHPNQVYVQASRSGSTFSSDASAIFDSNADRLYQLATDFNHYVDLEMPYLDGSHVADYLGGGNQLITWNSMSTRVLGISVNSQHCFLVQKEPRLPNGAKGTSWSLTRCPKSHANWDNPRFSHLKGAFYILPISSRGGDSKVYVRYYLEGIPSGVPAWLVAGVIRKQFDEGVVQVLEILRKAAE